MRWLAQKSRSRGYGNGRIAPWDGQRAFVEQNPVSQEHREFQRVGDTLLVSYSISDEFAPEFTETYDVAQGGMAMITNAALELDAPITVQLELRGDARPMLRLKGLVRWSQFDPLLARYRTGVSFVDVDEETQRDLRRYIDTLRLLRDMGVL